MPDLVKGSFKDLVHCLLGVAVPTMGEKVYYRSIKSGNKTFKIDAVFDDDYLTVDVNAEELISSQSPRLGVRLSDLPFEPTDNDLVAIGIRKFKVKDTQEDGQGGATIFLTEIK